MVHAGLSDELHPTPPVPRAVGGLLHFTEIRSRFLPHPHDVIVCLPPDYALHPDRRYPVLYLHDGQNVFDELAMSPFGVQWGIDTTARALMHAQVIEPMIIVAIGNAGRDRIDAGGLADRYGQMLVYELKPWVDHNWRTRRSARDTGLAGSSLGGLLTLHLGLTHSSVFGKIGLLSPSVWWDDRWIVRQLVANNGMRPTLKIWLDVGTGETRMLKGTRLLYRMLLRKGWQPGHDLLYIEADGALHDERAWGERSGLFLRFLFPAMTSSRDALASSMSSGMS